ncbi:12270_t:CDS:2 [Entrophospora sp. SA101]|nr:12270_t:CDS:2 [Entrophospora sp. SA101]
MSQQQQILEQHQNHYYDGHSWLISSHRSSSPSTNNDINNDRHQCLNNPDLNLNVSSFNSRINNEDPLIAAISYHMSMIKEHRMKISQHHFELEQMINMLRHRDNQDRK